MKTDLEITKQAAAEIQDAEINDDYTIDMFLSDTQTAIYHLELIQDKTDAQYESLKVHYEILRQLAQSVKSADRFSVGDIIAFEGEPFMVSRDQPEDTEVFTRNLYTGEGMYFPNSEPVATWEGPSINPETKAVKWLDGGEYFELKGVPHMFCYNIGNRITAFDTVAAKDVEIDGDTVVTLAENPYC